MIHPWQAAAVGVALAAGLSQKAGSESWTATSGESGAHTVDVTTTTVNDGMRGLKLWVYDQRACRLDLSQASLSGGAPRSVEGPKACEPQMAESWKALDVGAGNFVVAIQACTDAAHKLVGVRAWGAHPSADGSVGKPGKPAELELPGCSEWHAKVSCPAGTIATGVRGVYASDKLGVGGLALRCHALRVEKSPAP